MVSKCRMEMREDRISELEDRVVDFAQSECVRKWTTQQQKEQSQVTGAQ